MVQLQRRPGKEGSKFKNFKTLKFFQILDGHLKCAIQKDFQMALERQLDVGDHIFVLE